MPEDVDDDLAEKVCALRMGSVVAAAGCGKTEQIVKATSLGYGRRLILTHTHAGVDALRKRLKDQGVPPSQYSVETIAGWSLRYAASYPRRSGLSNSTPKGDQGWSAVYAAATKLIASGAVTRVLQASYSGLFVDEYQDCGGSQHRVIAAISNFLPVCVFGDPLQAIFDFNGQKPVDWAADVFPIFPEVSRLTTPWRWHRHRNIDMANWLEKVRATLENSQELDLRDRPACVKWEWLPDYDGPRQAKITNACLSAMTLDGSLVVIADPANLNGRALIAKKLGKQGFSNIEPIECKTAYAAATKLQASSGAKRLDTTLDFLEQCMSGVGRAEFIKAIASRKAGGSLGTAKFGALVAVGMALDQGAGDEMSLALIEGFASRSTCYVFRREMLSAMRSALKLKIAGESLDLLDALWQVQTKIRHVGRRIPHRSVGSTLLVKGLEFSNAVIVHSPNMNRKDWYVALTRATNTVIILSPRIRFMPSADRCG
jgi:DNA helicase-2/ATP-dependent DNA helicase PcrA